MKKQPPNQLTTKAYLQLMFYTIVPQYGSQQPLPLRRRQCDSQLHYHEMIAVIERDYAG